MFRPLYAWEVFCATWELLLRRSRKVWAAITRLHTSEARTLLYHLSRVDEAMRSGDNQALTQHTSQLLLAFQPPRLIAILEHVVTAQLLTRADVVGIEESILRRTRNTGLWR